MSLTTDYSGAKLMAGAQERALFPGGAVHGKQSISFTFPEIQEFWDRLVRRMLISSALWLMLLLATIGTRQGMGDGPYLVVLLVFGGLQLALSLDYWNRENKLIPRINQRLAVEFMLRTGTPAPPEDLDILQVKQTVTARDEDGAAHRWIVKRRSDMFTLTSKEEIDTRFEGQGN